MLTFEALRPLRLNTKTRGTFSLQPGERVTWPDEAVKQLLARIPERIRLVLESESEKPPPFQIGQAVTYRIPDPQTKSIYPAWQEHSGTVLQVDAFREMVLIEPTTEPGTSWRWVARCYVQVNQDEK